MILLSSWTFQYKWIISTKCRMDLLKDNRWRMKMWYLTDWHEVINRILLVWLSFFPLFFTISSESIGDLMKYMQRIRQTNDVKKCIRVRLRWRYKLDFISCDYALIFFVLIYIFSESFKKGSNCVLGKILYEEWINSRLGMHLISVLLIMFSFLLSCFPS